MEKCSVHSVASESFRLGLCGGTVLIPSIFESSFVKVWSIQLTHYNKFPSTVVLFSGFKNSKLQIALSISFIPPAFLNRVPLCASFLFMQRYLALFLVDWV